MESQRELAANFFHPGAELSISVTVHTRTVLDRIHAEAGHNMYQMRHIFLTNLRSEYAMLHSLLDLISSRVLSKRLNYSRVCSSVYHGCGIRNDLVKVSST
jgi:endonuclease III-like uncharacterized protein